MNVRKRSADETVRHLATTHRDRPSAQTRRRPAAMLEVWRLSIHLKGLILAQNERWRRGLGMQVERESVECGFGQVKQRKAANGVVIHR
jgi:hypothetical protein